MSSSEPALLGLANGKVFRGRSVGVEGSKVGEIIFNTSMTGYQEILTDPSYAKQIVTLTYPHIGNTGTNEEDYESTRVWAEGLVVRDVPGLHSNYRSQYSLSDFLRRENVVAISEIDTRQLTRIIREEGALNACISASESVAADEIVERARAFSGLKGLDLAKEVTRAKPEVWSTGSWSCNHRTGKEQQTHYRVVCYDFGVKRNILRLLVDRHCEVIVVPATTPSAEALSFKPDGILLSNGPGDPAACDYAITAIQDLFKVPIPVFGICLGCQLLALAGGAKTIKMKFGHHGANHPVREIAGNRVLITSQNHGFCVDKESLPEHFEVTHLSLFDGTLQGLRHKEYPVMGFQGHPEASPGPQDNRCLFDDFIRLIQQYKTKQHA